MARAAEIAALRALGLSLAQVGRVLGGDPACLDAALAAHQSALEGEMRRLAGTVAKVHALRADLAGGAAPAAGELARLVRNSEREIAFALPWPWGERFVLRDIRAPNYIVGPLGSGKTRLARAIAEALPDAAFIGMDRAADAPRLDADPALKSKVDRTLAWLIEEGATASASLTALLVALEFEAPAVLVVDMVEQGLDQASQEALMAHLRGRGPECGRSSCSRARARSWICPWSAPARRSSSAPPTTARRPRSRPTGSAGL